MNYNLSGVNEFWNNQVAGYYNQLADIVPKLVSALIVILVGYFIAISLKKLIVKILRKLKINTWVSKTNLDEELQEAGIKMDLAEFFGNFAKWIVYIVVLLFVVDIFGLDKVNTFIENILDVIGNIILGLFIFIITVYVARFTETITGAVAKYIEFKNTELAKKIVAGIIYFIGLMFFIDTLNLEIFKEFIMTLITGITAGLSLAFGIAFGLGGQEKAKKVIEKLKK